MKLYLLTASIIVTLTSCIGQPPEGVERITMEIVKENVIGKEVQLIDVRRPEEYVKGHIDDAVNINIADMDFFKQEVAKLDKTKPIYLYCHGGKRSKKASKIVKELGFEAIYDFSGGWKVWSEKSEK